MKTQNPQSKIRAVHFGAGNIGRGLIAQIYKANKFDINFIDKDPENLRKYEKLKNYNINFLDKLQTLAIKNFKLILDDDETKIIRWLRKATFVSTSIGVNNLESLVPLFEKAYKNTVLEQQVHVICFENGYRVSSAFRKLVKKLIKNDNVHFLDVVVDRIVPKQHNEDWSINTEAFYEIVADRNQHNSKQFVTIEGINYNRNLDAYINKKLILLNAVHTLIGLLGYKNKLRYIEDSLANSPILSLVKKYQSEAIDALVAEYPEEFTKRDLEDYANKTIKRFSNPLLKDTNLRVIRNPITKMQDNERYMSAINLALKHNLKYNYLVVPFMLLTSLEISNDKQSKELKSFIKTKGIKKALQTYSSLSEEVIQFLLK